VSPALHINSFVYILNELYISIILKFERADEILSAVFDRNDDGPDEDADGPFQINIDRMSDHFIDDVFRQYDQFSMEIISRRHDVQVTTNSFALRLV